MLSIENINLATSESNLETTSENQFGKRNLAHEISLWKYKSEYGVNIQMCIFFFITKALIRHQTEFHLLPNQ